MRLCRHLARTFHDAPSLVGAMVTFIAVIAVGLLLSPWINVFAGTPAFDALSFNARLIYGAIFLLITLLTLWRPIRAGGTGVAFLAAFEGFYALVKGHNIVGVIFWVTILLWTLIAIWRALRSRYASR